MADYSTEKLQAYNLGADVAEEITDPPEHDDEDMYLRKYDDRVEKARADFGKWDPYDAVGLIILRLVELQNQITCMTIQAHHVDSPLGSTEEIEKLIKEREGEREQAALDLKKALSGAQESTF